MNSPKTRAEIQAQINALQQELHSTPYDKIWMVTYHHSDMAANNPTFHTTEDDADMTMRRYSTLSPKKHVLIPEPKNETLLPSNS